MSLQKECSSAMKARRLYTRRPLNARELGIGLISSPSWFKTRTLRRVGIVVDRFKAKALRNLESENHWMVNLSCQFQGFNSLINDFGKQLPLFLKVAENCLKITNFFNSRAQLRAGFEKLQLQELDTVGLIIVLQENHFFGAFSSKNFRQICPTLKDIMGTARALQLVVMDDSFKLLCSQDPLVREVEDKIGDMGFWNKLEVVLSLTKSIKTTAQEIETSGISWSPSSPLVVFQRAGDRGSVVSW
ncbi:hypothetical protein AMTR_s00181p00032190 [Amborella trichopoda]|uniref:Uncharacterized protein n=1 Tax=Amborella trichopoda TaxID=13333 RepID=W1P608_AMBTC|nr:hypothetical protein AMTR_s00181p00032190 [Amborella trichopoda]